ncbi:hypothetical protein FDUTEX481_03575 [Tolypothrix sp. PCC 7601]|nr:hypothetical protein FDUTEX481_03575 [Tolypothrix sp. PCC 7601]
MVCFSYKVWRDGNRHRQLCAIYADLYYFLKYTLQIPRAQQGYTNLKKEGDR